MVEKYAYGIFVEECKNIFTCKVKIVGEDEQLCYVSCSSKLKSFIDLNNKEVLLVRNVGKGTKTRYTLLAVKYNSTFILVNL